MKRWLVVVSLLGAAVVWVVRLARELSSPPVGDRWIHVAGWGDDDPLPPRLEPWWTYLRALEEEGLPPPV